MKKFLSIFAVGIVLVTTICSCQKDNTNTTNYYNCQTCPPVTGGNGNGNPQPNPTSTTMWTNGLPGGTVYFWIGYVDSSYLDYSLSSTPACGAEYTYTTTKILPGTYSLYGEDSLSIWNSNITIVAKSCNTFLLDQTGVGKTSVEGTITLKKFDKKSAEGIAAKQDHNLKILAAKSQQLRLSVIRSK
jgi:hypothetical protein